MEGKKESSLLVDAMTEAAMARKQQQNQNTRDFYARNINRLARREVDLKVNVQNLKWEKKRLENDTLKLKVEHNIFSRKRANENQKSTTEEPKPPNGKSESEKQKPASENPKPDNKGQKSAKEPRDDFMYRSFPSPASSESTLDPLDSQSTSIPPQQPKNSLPLQSTYEPFLPDQDFRPPQPKIKRAQPKPEEPSQPTFGVQYIFPYPFQFVKPSDSSREGLPQPYIPPFVSPGIPHVIPVYVPSPINTLENNPIKCFKDRSSAYWRRFAIAIEQLKVVGKSKVQNPEDQLWFQVQVSPKKLTRIRLDKKWLAIEDGCNH